MRSMAQPEDQGSAGATASKGSGASYSAAAAPAHALLSCITAMQGRFSRLTPCHLRMPRRPCKTLHPASRPPAEQSIGEAAVTQASGRLQEGPQQSTGAASKQSGVGSVQQGQVSGASVADPGSAAVRPEVSPS